MVKTKILTFVFGKRLDGAPKWCMAGVNRRYTKDGPLVKWPKTPASHAGNMGSNPVRVTRNVTAMSRLQIDGG